MNETLGKLQNLDPSSMCRRAEEALQGIIATCDADPDAYYCSKGNAHFHTEKDLLAELKAMHNELVMLLEHPADRAGRNGGNGNGPLHGIFGADGRGKIPCLHPDTPRLELSRDP